MNATANPTTTAPETSISDPVELPPVLAFEQVSKWYGPVIGVNQATLILQGGITGLVGANGAGKSTLLRLAVGQLKPTIGRVSIRGIDAWNWQAKRQVGYCPDIDVFYEEMSGRQFVLTMAKLCGYRRSEAHDRTEATLKRVGMVDRADRRIRGYSKGMRQRIKLAQAILHDPGLIVLDEPLSGIDPIGRQELLDLFRELAGQGKCLLISSHELEELEKLTDHIAIMARGRIAAVGTVRQIRDLLDDQPLSIRIDTSAPRKLAGLLIARDDVEGVDVRGDMLTLRVRNPKRFFNDFNRLVLDGDWEIHHLEPLDESTHAVLGYLLGGSGKT
ncbi:ABC transporter ATP-binding protein [Tuwongella immobilis]|uniref:ABC transporter domain-containing protein n=1 Tax=Tuwongella immobilis TaxID=692036 RepID=A0A6C2YR76_9BACT|nr:ABC transporter ATP-binding protein [Tuwongella immobilis]VIP04148.1 abc transporter : ABC transporter, ATP-binding protein NosF OS=Fimbriimonas ginsengisoli Gsoil 348 GN=OP10G_2311 PE=3 SV=1: ABC_tran [Tuwongella immobilis]VTS05661.1 abc transporter : ABC transporter, ATP-binding protein NosF OS=Fimbriimonas ginsengisoli Gsoil 348 GN=OP10G_2311 PE=3 SV=1: ABC_tran [Tuwongella immobilis]